jgi:hypothetical protein
MCHYGCVPQRIILNKLLYSYRMLFLWHDLKLLRVNNIDCHLKKMYCLTNIIKLRNIIKSIGSKTQWQKMLRLLLMEISEQTRQSPLSGELQSNGQ